MNQNNGNGCSYDYSAACGVQVPEHWTEYKCNYEGFSNGYGDIKGKFRLGTKIVSPFVICNSGQNDDAILEILKNSNNFIAETVFKLAGAKYSGSTGTQENSLAMLNAYFTKNDIIADEIKIVDGSGVSKNNLLTADFMTNFLYKISSDTEYIKTLPTSGEGTLARRMLYFKDNLRAKTGTLSDVSAIAGYITARSGKTYAFDIMINEPKSKSADKKSLEEYILRDIYSNF